MNPYTCLQPFTHFVNDAFDAEQYAPVPDDWLIIVADIDDSTLAALGGNYEAVNFVGAAVVAALGNTIEEQFPIIFGGDGASAVIPPECEEIAASTLLSLRRWSFDQFSLTLRVGIVPMTDVIERGGRLEMGKMSLSPGNEVAMLRGSGLDMADGLIKHDTISRYRLELIDEDWTKISYPNLEDLSCRWSPIASERGVMLCLIIGVTDQSANARRNPDKVYSDVIRQIDRIVGIDNPHTNPVHVDNLNFKISWSSLTKELKARHRSKFLGIVAYDIVSVFAFHLLAKLLFMFGFKLGEFDPERYVEQVAINSDFIRVAGMVSMVLDCSSDQANHILTMLDDRFRSGQLVYGEFETDQALMTCVTPDVIAGHHLHHIDGSDGGLWRAAEKLKARIVQRASVNQKT